MERKPDIEVVFKFNGKKQHSMKSGYRPAHLINKNLLVTGIHYYYKKEIVSPNDTVQGTITFLTPEFYPHTLWMGKEIQIQEGEIVVGTATITNIFNPVLVK